MKFTVKQESELLPFLFGVMADKSRTTVKSFLTHRQVAVNGCVTTQHNTPLSPGDVVDVSREKGKEALRHPMLRIVYEDDHIIVIDKREGLLSIGTDKEQRKSAFYILSDYVKRQDPHNMLFVIHRLDRETSGLMMFARDQKVQETIQRGWRELVRDRRYVAVVEGTPPEAQGSISSYLTEDKNLKMWAAVKGDGPLAVTHYAVMKSGRAYSLVDVKLETGKKNQIRAHFEYVKAPIAGDKKYSATTNPLGRVCLHAYKLHITHPVTSEPLDFSTRIPKAFEDVVATK